MRSIPLRGRSPAAILPLAVIALATVETSARAAAGSEAFTVRWLTPPACLQTEALETEIARLVGDEVRAEDALHFEARFSATEDGAHQLVLRAQGKLGESERAVTARSCQQLREITIVLIAAALDPHASELAAPVRESTPARAPRQAWSLAIAALGDLQSLPGVSGGPVAGVSLELAPARLWLEARYLAPRGEDTGVPGATSAFQLFASGLGAARVWQVAKLAAGPCAELELGYLHGRVSGVEDGRRAGSVWASALAGGLVDQPLGQRVGLQLRALFGVPLYRPRFGYRSGTPFHTTEAFTIRLWVGVRITLGPRTAAPLAIQKGVAFVTQ